MIWYSEEECIQKNNRIKQDKASYLSISSLIAIHNASSETLSDTFKVGPCW